MAWISQRTDKYISSGAERAIPKYSNLSITCLLTPFLAACIARSSVAMVE